MQDNKMGFTSSEFLEDIIPCSEKIESLLEEYISECVSWNEVGNVLELNKQQIKKFSEEFTKMKLLKANIIHAILLVLIKKEETSDECIIDMKKDKQILIVCTSTLFLVNSGYFDIVFWLDIVLELCCFFKVHGLASFTKWICGCYEEFNWAISNPSVPFDQRGLSQEYTEGVLKSSPGGDISPSVAAQRQLAQAKFVGLLKLVSKRLVGYSCTTEAGILRSFVCSILPTNQAGICRKSFSPRVYSSFDIEEQLESIFEASTIITDSEAQSEYDTDKEEGEMSKEKEDNPLDLIKSDYRRFLEPFKYVRSVFMAYKRVDAFFQTFTDFLNSMVDNSESLSYNKKKQIDDICKDIETVVSYFEDYKYMDIHYPSTQIQVFVSTLEGIPSSLESYYFRVNFAYKLSFILCCQLTQIIDGCKHGCEYMHNKLIPLLQKCLGSIDKLKHNGSATIFINNMIKYEFFWQHWKNNNCVDIDIPPEKLTPLPEITKTYAKEIIGYKKRKIEKNETVTKFIDDETFSNYMYFINKCSNADHIENFNSITIRNIDLPNFTTERTLLYLDQIDLDLYSSKCINYKVINKLNDYKEKILIDLDPDNGIDESEKSIKDPIIRWRCNRLHKRIYLEHLNKLSEVQLSINNIESIIKDKNIQEPNSFPDKTNFEFLKMYPL